VEAFGPFSGMSTFVEIEGALYLRLDPSHESTKYISEKIENIKHPKIESMSFFEDLIYVSFLESIIDLEPELMERVAVIEKMRQETSKSKKSMLPRLLCDTLADFVEKPQKKIIPQNTQTASPTSFAQMQVVKQKSPK
jgi:hypothetical protein